MVNALILRKISTLNEVSYLVYLLMASRSEKDNPQKVSDMDEKMFEKFSELHLCLNELNESNRRILSRLDNLNQTPEEDPGTRFQDRHGGAIAELEKRIGLIKSHERRREKELKELQQTLKTLMEKSDYCHGVIFSGGPGATVPSLEKNVDINAAGISEVGVNQQQSNDNTIYGTSIQHEIAFRTPEISFGTPKHSLSRTEDQKKSALSSTNVVFQQELKRLEPEGSESRDRSELRLVKADKSGLSALHVQHSEKTTVHNLFKEHASGLRDSKQICSDIQGTKIIEPEIGHVIEENMSPAESSTTDVILHSNTQDNKPVELEGEIVSICHRADYNLKLVEKKVLRQSDCTETKVQYTESGYLQSASNISSHSDHMQMTVNSKQSSISKLSGKNLKPQRSQNVLPNVLPKVNQDADSYSNQPVLKLRASTHVTSSDYQMQKGIAHVAEHQNILNFSKNKTPVQENIDLDHSVVEEYTPSVMWMIHAQSELEQALKQKVHEIHTVLCVDISASMREGVAWNQTQTFVTSFLSGLEEVISEGNSSHDFVSLSVFGHETRVVQRLTSDFQLLHTSFDCLKLGGPTQMYGGLLMARAGLGGYSCPTLSHIRVGPRIILISDGKPSSPSLCAGPDIYSESNQEQIQSEILTVVEEIANRAIKIYCIPVGSNPNMKFLEKIANDSKGKMFTHKDGRYLARRTRNTAFAAHAVHHWKIMNGMKSFFGGEVSLEDLIMGLERGSQAARAMPGTFEMAVQSKADKDQILALANEALEEGTYEEADILSRNYESTDPSCGLPPLGSRVCRGPDWIHDMQDNGGPGTVVGHIKEDTNEILVTWDKTGQTCNYRYGPHGYDVVIVEEPRLLQFDELIGTGCVVQRGKDWKWKNQDGVPGAKGVVLKVLEDGQVIVRWPNKSKNVYRYGADGFFDLEICNPFENSSVGRMTQAADTTSLFSQKEMNTITSSWGGKGSTTENKATTSMNMLPGKTIKKNKNAK